MILLRPAALLVLLLALPIIALYVLRLRRPDRPISSTLLWHGLVEDMRANAPWQRLRPSLLLGVQLAVLAALAIALAEPALSRSRDFAGDAIIILDQSYSMQATDALPSRFAAAQQKADALASQLSATSAVSVIGMGSTPTLAVAQSADAGAIRDSVARLSAGARDTNIPAALSLASSLARPGRKTELFVLTDHSSSLSLSAIHANVPVRVMRFGGLRRDLGIVGFAASSGTYTHALVRLRNFGNGPARSDLNLYADGQLVDVRPVSLAAGSSTSLSWDHLPAGARRLRARLSIKDDMPADKSAWAVVPVSAQRHVLLVSRNDYYLETALALDPDVAVQVVTPGGYAASLSSHPDVVILDRWAPSSRPGAPLLAVDPPRRSWIGVQYGTPGGEAHLAISTSAARSLMRYVDVNDVHVSGARVLRLARGLRPLLSAGGETVAATGQRQGYRQAVISFPLEATDWPLRISFPVFIHNLMEYLAPGTGVSRLSVPVGTPERISPSPSTQTLMVTRPDGVVRRLLPPFAPYTDTREPGVYSVATTPSGLAPVLFAVNAFPPGQRDLPAPSQSRRGTSAGTAGTVSVPLDLGWAAALVVLALLVVEWWIGMRR